MVYDPAFEAHCNAVLRRLVEADPESANLVAVLLRRPRRKAASRVVEMFRPGIVSLGLAEPWELGRETWRTGTRPRRGRVARNFDPNG